MKNIKLLLIAVILVAIAFVLQHGSRQTVATDPMAGRNLVTASELDGVAEINLHTDAGKVTLKKSGETWRLPDLHNLRADRNRVEELFQRMTAAKTVETVSANPQRHTDLGVASMAANAPVTGQDCSRLSLSNAAGGLVKQIYLGKGRQSKMVDGSQGFGNDGQYFRYEGDDKVYLLSTFLWLEKDTKNWLSKDLLKLDSDKVNRVAWLYSGSKEKFSLARANASASLDLEKPGEGMQTRQSAVAGVSSIFAGFSFDDLVATDTPEQHPALADRLELSLETFDGLKLSMLISSGTADIPGAGKMHLLWLNAEYAGNDPVWRNFADELSGNAKKLLFALQPQRIKPLLLKAADLSEPKPVPPPETATGTAAASATVSISTAEKVSASHILLSYKGAGSGETTRSEEDAKKLAEELLAKIKKGEDFAVLARENSDCPSGKSASGSLGEFGRGAMVKEFEDAAFALKVGEVSGLVKTSFGYHIIRRDK